MKFILATKENMTEYFEQDGTVIPVTILSAGPVTVTRVFEKEKDGYNSVQVGYGIQKKERINKAQIKSMKGGFYKTLKEFRLKPSDTVEVKEGRVIDVSAFSPGDKLQVTSVSKGKGFQGVVKRHGFSGGPRTHGQKHSEREPGSIGGGLRTHVPKGMRMAGRMGSDRITQKNLKVVFVDAENNLMLVKGAIAGKRGTLVEIVAR
ncbi:MAG: 50S ribosomal protein L3 [Candidatus Nomurabacteria bacterium GW2011_GWF2_40_31]|uniref:50S ribosomal protein L3 n=2 Tax=Candidatus Nomuraibacteriota TaxID=1752729 RepID=A0A837HW83_9BACT|nr:MAG: 50S ribosomal protein L3 [Candidatus Nomurabacteria bacterium GW2011_GWD2_39_12]KKR20614.1 MAG: 50S ribosomal protein L3 [Candidatus Nomurabacteria bacterium GW2011_GWC2_39_41]KKR37457.1 MAG: 50S ribosomal protein L3 [Candidatus Nomurabacteria bacterium GW2011_GWE2_40_10]KKR38705.1 MAG: 50S ribosomal protein L3 [Candidatus Nomurabacteria bacterium GW2011_GWB1_40_11]KKR40430.1 MAG: 50S ribosomal protein L3 [Parcubacteria group bacterium GW2011_GWC1_40_11]KKR59461.1 MAG: 50S ribosomal pr